MAGVSVGSAAWEAAPALTYMSRSHASSSTVRAALRLRSAMEGRGAGLPSGHSGRRPVLPLLQRREESVEHLRGVGHRHGRTLPRSVTEEALQHDSTRPQGGAASGHEPAQQVPILISPLDRHIAG